MHIDDILSAKGSDVATVRADTLVSDALAELDRLRIGALVVSADGATIDGIVSERDIVRELHRRGAGLLTEPVRSIMTTPVHTASPEDTPESVMAMMTELRVRHVPVLRDGALHGLVSIGDVVKSRIEDLEAGKRELVEYITAR